MIIIDYTDEFKQHIRQDLQTLLDELERAATSCRERALLCSKRESKTVMPNEVKVAAVGLSTT